jgi:hypothetical protein
MEQQLAHADGLDAVDAVAMVDLALHHYAERGVFQDYRMARRRQGGAQYDFGWLYGQPFTLVCDERQRRLVVTDLLPGVERDSMMHKEIKAFLKGRAAADVPEHRRVDPALATASVRLRDGLLSLELTLAEAPPAAPRDYKEYEYGARKIVNLTHELFLFMNEYWADYMWENFRLNME